MQVKVNATACLLLAIAVARAEPCFGHMRAVVGGATLRQTSISKPITAVSMWADGPIVKSLVDREVHHRVQMAADRLDTKVGTPDRPVQPKNRRASSVYQGLLGYLPMVQRAKYKHTSHLMAYCKADAADRGLLLEAEGSSAPVHDAPPPEHPKKRPVARQQFTDFIFVLPIVPMTGAGVAGATQLAITGGRLVVMAARLPFLVFSD